MGMETSGSAVRMPGHSQTGEGPSPAGSSSGSEDRSKLGVGESVARRLHTQRSGGRLRMDFLKPRKGFASGSGDTVAAARPSSTGYSGLPFSPTHASPTSAAYPSNMMAPLSFTGAMLSAGSSLPNAESDVTSTTVAFGHGDRPGMYTESSLSASSTSVLGSSPRPSLPAIHTTFARSSAGSSQELRLSNEARRDSEGSSVAPSATLDQDTSSAPTQTQNDQPADEGCPTSTTGPHSSHHAAHLWQLKNGLHSAISPLSSSASHTTYLPSAISDPHGLHSLHVAPRVPFAERAYANSFAHSAISDESVEDVSMGVSHQSVPPTPAGDVTWGSTQGGLTALVRSEDAARRAGLMGAAVRDGNITSNEHGRGIFGNMHTEAPPLHGRTRCRVTSTSVRSSIIPHELLWLRLQSCYGRGAFPPPLEADSTGSRHADPSIPHEQMAPDATAIDARGSFATDNGTGRELSTAGNTTFSRLDRAADAHSRPALVSWDSAGLASQKDADLAMRQSEGDAVFNASLDPADALGSRRRVASRTELSNAGNDGSWPVPVAHSLPVRLQHAPGVPRTATAPPSPPVQHAFETKDAGVTGGKEKDRYELLSQMVEASSLDFSRNQRADRDEDFASMPSFVKGERMTESSAASSPRSDLAAAAAAEGAMQARAHAAAPPPPPRHAGVGFRQGVLDAPSRERASRQAAGAPMPSELKEQMERSDLTEHAHSAKSAEIALSHGNPSLGRRLQVRELSAPQDLSMLSNSAVIAARAPNMRGETQATQHSTCDLGADAALQHGTPSTAWSRDVLDSAPSGSRPRGDQYDRQSISASSPPAFVSTSTAPTSLYHSQHLDLASSDTASHAASHPSFASTSSFESRTSTDQRLIESEVLTSLTQPRSLFDNVSFDPCSRRPLLLLDARSLQAYRASRLKGSFHLDLKNRPVPRAVGKGATAFIASILPDMAKRRFSETVGGADIFNLAERPSKSPNTRSFELDDTLPGPSSRPWPFNSEQEQRFWSATDVVLITDDAEDLASNVSIFDSDDATTATDDSSAVSTDRAELSPRTPEGATNVSKTPPSSGFRAQAAANAYAQLFSCLQSPVRLEDGRSTPANVFLVRGDFLPSPVTDDWLEGASESEVLVSPLSQDQSRDSPPPSAVDVSALSLTAAERWVPPVSAPAFQIARKHSKGAGRKPKGLDLSAAQPGSARHPHTAIPIQADQSELETVLERPSTDAEATDAPSQDLTPHYLVVPPTAGIFSSASDLSANTSQRFPAPTPSLMRPPGPPRRPMLARLDTSERVKTLQAAAPQRRASATSPRLQLQTRTDFLRSPVRSATLDGPLGHGRQPEVATFADHYGGIPTDKREIIMLSPRTAPSSRDVITTAEGSDRTPVHVEAPVIVDEPRRRGSEPLVGGLNSPRMDTTTDLLPEPATPAAVRSRSVSSGEAADSEFVVSEILPGFLFLGPDIATTSEAEHLVRDLGVRRILNCALEIEEGGGKHLALNEGRLGIEKYRKIPLKDTVEAEGVQSHIDEACAFLDDARLYGTPTYVHCKAGKSRSVLVVMAYLIHHLGWPLSQAYSHVVARRRTVSPNLGFVAELMAFEKRRQEIAHTSIVHSSAERGAKSAKDTVDETTADQVIGASDSGRQRRVRDPRARDSLPYLPPTLSAEQVTRVDELPSQSETSNDQEAAPVEEHLAPSTRPSKASFGLEHRGEDGRYRSRRPPADAHILAPSRRATIAALGSDHQEKLNELLGDARRLHR